jgi:hypothetical protein
MTKAEGFSIDDHGSKVYTTAAGTVVYLLNFENAAACDRASIHRAEHQDKVDAALADVDNLDRETLIWLAKDLDDTLQEIHADRERDRDNQ